MSVTCVELAEKFDVDPEIIRLLKYGVEKEEKMTISRGRNKPHSSLFHYRKCKRILKANKNLSMIKAKLRNRVSKK